MRRLALLGFFTSSASTLDDGFPETNLVGLVLHHWVLLRWSFICISNSICRTRHFVTLSCRRVLVVWPYFSYRRSLHWRLDVCTFAILWTEIGRFVFRLGCYVAYCCRRGALANFHGSDTIECDLITFRVRHRRSEMYIGHGRLCVCAPVCVSVCPSPHSHITAWTRV